MLSELLADLARWEAQEKQFALATLVGIQGSAPRLPGARLAVTPELEMSGSVSGGCVEAAVCDQALVAMKTGRPLLARFGISDEQGFEVGLSCGGTIEVLIESFTADPAWTAIRKAVTTHQPAALAIGLDPEPLRGRRLAIGEADSLVGEIDPLLDAEIAAAARRQLSSGSTRTLDLPWKNSHARVFVEPLPPPLHLYIVGATHAAVHLCRLAAQVGFRVTVIDARGIFATPERFPEADEVIHAWPQEALPADRLDAFSYLVTLTHDEKIDTPALARGLRSQARYVGALGSRATHARRLVRMREEGFTDAELVRLRAPIGLDLGGRGPEAIALSILAEMMAVRHGRSGSPLSEGSQAIHGD